MKPRHKHEGKPERSNIHSSQLAKQSQPSLPVQSAVSLEHQQQILNVFRGALVHAVSDPKSTIQEVKKSLYDRDFEFAFSSTNRRAAYALRWSSSRALGYTEVLCQVWEPITGVGDVEGSEAGHSETEAEKLNGKPRTSLNAFCLGGGGGAELVALASYARQKLDALQGLNVTVIDISDWSDIIYKLYQGLTTALQPPRLVATANVLPVVDRSFSAHFLQRDLLASGLDWACLRDADLVTLMFALNELYAVSRVKATRFLLDLTRAMTKDSILLIVDSPGSYSTVKLGKEPEKANPHAMRWLLDLTLLKAGEDGVAWEKLIDDSSRWFRLPEGLKYPLELENMRYQIHMYRHT